MSYVDEAPRSPILVSLPGGGSAVKAYCDHSHGPVVAQEFESVQAICEHLRRSRDPVLLSLGDGITTEDLASLTRAAHQNQVPTGFIDGWRGQEAAIRHAASLALWRSRRPSGCDVWIQPPHLEEMQGTFGDVRIGGNGLPPPDPDHRGARVLGLLKHGNGIDGRCGDEVLCGLLDAADDLPLVNYFPCGSGGECIRLPTLRLEGTAGRLRASSSLPGDVIIMAMCYGMLASDAVFDPRGGMVRGLIDASDVRQVLTTFHTLQPDVSALIGACLLADRGMPLGNLLRLLNNAAEVIRPYDSPPWLLLGDPTVRLPWDGPLFDPPESIDESLAGIMSVAGDEADRVVLTDTDEPGEARIWAAAIPGNPLVTWCRDPVPAATKVSLRVVRPSQDASQLTLRRIWSSGDRLEFTHEFLQLAAANEYYPGFEYPPSTQAATAATISRIRSMAACVTSGLAGPAKDIDALAGAESQAWALLSTELLNLLVGFFQEGGSTIDHIYREAGAHSVEGIVTPCPYCRSEASVETVSMRPQLSPRQNTICIRCTVISDADTHLGTGYLAGPDEVRAGEEAHYVFGFTGQDKPGVHHGRASVLMQSIPGVTEKVTAITFTATVGSDIAADLTWRVPAELTPGRYFLLAPMIIDGGITVLRRPIVIRRTDGS